MVLPLSLPLMAKVPESLVGRYLQTQKVGGPYRILQVEVQLDSHTHRTQGWDPAHGTIYATSTLFQLYFVRTTTC